VHAMRQRTSNNKVQVIGEKGIKPLRNGQKENEVAKEKITQFGLRKKKEKYYPDQHE